MCVRASENKQRQGEVEGEGADGTIACADGSWAEPGALPHESCYMIAITLHNLHVLRLCPIAYVASTYNLQLFEQLNCWRAPLARAACTTRTGLQWFSVQTAQPNTSQGCCLLVCYQALVLPPALLRHMQRSLSPFADASVYWFRHEVCVVWLGLRFATSRRPCLQWCTVDVASPVTR